MFVFFFGLFVTWYRLCWRIRRPVFLSESNRLTSSSLQNDELGELPSGLSGSAPDTPSMFNASFNKYRGSIASIEGFEKNLHVLAKDQYPGRAMGVFTSGGDAQGIY
jgi:hypothetical protein